MKNIIYRPTRCASDPSRPIGCPAERLAHNGPLGDSTTSSIDVGRLYRHMSLRMTSFWNELINGDMMRHLCIPLGHKDSCILILGLLYTCIAAGPAVVA